MIINQSDELGALKADVCEFLKRHQNIENEIATLKEDKKELINEFKSKLDMRTLQAALRVVKIESGVDHKDAYDAFMDVLKDDETNGLLE